MFVCLCMYLFVFVVVNGCVHTGMHVFVCKRMCTVVVCMCLCVSACVL